MKKTLCTILLLTSTTLAHADNKTITPTINWVSKANSDAVNIANGSGLSLIVSINVNKNGAGVNIKNCGSTTHIDAGSIAICSTSDADSQISFSSDVPDKSASGSYQITSNQ